MHGRTFIGILLILLGAGFLLDKVGIIAFGTLISTYWPVFLIVIGANQFFSRGHSSISGIALILVGLFFVLKNLELLPSDIGRYFWPVLLIVIGVLIIFGRSRHGGMPAFGDDAINHFVLFSGLESRCVSKSFKGGSASAIFGGIELDLRDADLAKEGAFLDLTAAFGGINIKVPDQWKVVVKGTPLFGGWENKTKAPVGVSENDPILNIRCFAMFGGIEISN